MKTYLPSVIFYLFLSAISYLLSPICLYAEPGTTALNYLKIVTGVKGVGMGEAYTAVADDIQGFYWNPAGISLIEYQGISSSYTKWFQDVNYQTLSYLQSTKIGTFVASTYNLSYGTIDGYNAGGVPTEDLSAYSRAIIISYAKKLQQKQKLYFGMNIKLVQEKLDAQSVNAYALDFGSLYKFNIPLSLGISLQNIGPEVKYVSEKDPLPFNIKLGISYKFFSDDLTFAVDYNIPNDNIDYFNTGLEYQFLDLFKLRAGYKFKDIEGVRLGFGIGNEKITLDYAFVPYGILGDTHLWGLNFYFGKVHRLDAAQSRIEKYLKRGKRFFSKNDFIAAQKEFKNVLIYDPTHTEAQKYLAQIKSGLTEINVEKYLISGKKYILKGEFLKAKELFENILSLVSENEQAKKELADVEVKIQDEKKRRLEVLFSQGVEFYERGEYEDAISIWEKVLLLDKEHSASKEYILLAQQDIEKREKLKAEERIKILYETAEELFKKEKYKKALDLFTEIDRQSKGYMQTEMYLSDAKEKVAQMYFNEALKLSENNFYKEAMEIFEKSLKYAPDYKEALENINKCKGKMDEESEKNRFLADEYNKKGLIEYNQGHLKEAIKFWKKALELNPSHETAGKNLERAKGELKK